MAEPGENRERRRLFWREVWSMTSRQHRLYRYSPAGRPLPAAVEAGEPGATKGDVDG